MKRITSIFLILVLLLSLSSNAFAYNLTNTDTQYFVPNENTIQHKFTKADILTLEKYVSVNKKGFFELDKKQAKDDGIDDSLLDGQQDYFNYLNSLIKKGEITANENLEIRNNNTKVTASHWASCGGGLNTSVTYYWWGYSRYACDCETQRMSADFNSVHQLVLE